MRSAAGLLAPALALAVLGQAACGLFNPPQGGPGDYAIGPISTGSPPYPPEDAPPADARVEADSVIIHPLTRIGADSTGTPAIVLHLDVRDRFGQSIKSFGVLRAQLVAYGRSPTGSAEDDGRIWDVDLRSPRTNALMYDDLVTRTYTIPLGGLPDWIIAWSREQHTDDPDVAASDRPDLRVWFTVTDGNRAKTFRATRRLDP